MDQTKGFDKVINHSVASGNRRHWVSVMLVWIGSLICVPSILVGSDLAGGMSFFAALIAGLIGYGLLFVITALQGAQAADLGRPTVVMAKPSFGAGTANYLFSFIIAIALIGWYGVQATIAGASFQQLLAIFNVNINITLATIIIGALMLISAVYGFKAMEKLNVVAVPLLIVVLLWASVNALNSADLTQLWSYSPKSGSEMNMITGVSMVFGSFIVGGVIAGDYTRYNKDRYDTFKSAFFGIMPVGLLLIMIGAFLAITSNQEDPDVIATLTSHIPIPAFALITLLLATWTTNVSNAYSAGISLVNGLKLSDNKRALVTAISGAIGTLLAVLGILSNFITFLSVLTTLVTPIAGVMIADYWILNKGKSANYMMQVASPWVGVVAWILGSIPGLMVLFLDYMPAFVQNNQLLVSILSGSGIFVAMAFYVICKGGKKYA